jgi:hypothetical protein
MRSRLPLKSPANDEDPAWLAGEDHKPERLFETPGIESLRSGSMAHEQRILLRIKDGARCLPLGEKREQPSHGSDAKKRWRAIRKQPARPVRSAGAL